MENRAEYPVRPAEPAQSDCCGSGCMLCVFDVYEQELKIWQEQCTAIDRGLVQESSELNPESYSSMQIIEVEEMSWNTKLYMFQSKGLMGIKLGQHLVLRCVDEEGNPVTRQYTPLLCPSQTEFQVLVKIYPDGRMSGCVRRWNKGDSVSWRGPFGCLKYRPNQYSHLVLVAGGTGICPLVALIEDILNNGDDFTRIHLLNANKLYKDILFRSKLKEWSRYWNFSVKHFLSQDSLENVKKSQRYDEVIILSRISHDAIQAEVEGFRECGNADSVRAFVCGSRPFESNVVDWLNQVGIDDATIF